MFRKFIDIIDKLEEACRPDRGYNYSSSVDFADSIGLFVICALLLFTVFV